MKKIEITIEELEEMVDGAFAQELNKLYRSLNTYNKKYVQENNRTIDKIENIKRDLKKNLKDKFKQLT